MDKFSIFKKTEKFYWSVNKIYYCTLFSILGLAYFLKDVSKSAEKSFLWFSIATLITGLILKFRGLTQIEPLRGTLEGDLIFDEVNQVKYLEDNKSNLLIEPALTIRGGLEKVKLQLQYGYSLNLSNSDFTQDKGYLTLGLNFNLK